MKILVRQPRIIWGAALFTGVVGILQSYIFSDGSAWFQRSGSVITLIGIAASAWPFLFEFRKTFTTQLTAEYPDLKSEPEPGDTDFQISPSKQFDNRRKEIRTEMRSTRHFVAVTIVGTGVWGYGDLIYDLILKFIPVG